MSNVRILQGKIITAYDADARDNKLIGVFSSMAMASRYFYKTMDCSKGQGRVSSALTRNSNLFKHRFAFRVVLRYALPIYVELLGTQDYIIMDGHVLPSSDSMKGFTNNRGNMGQYVG